MLCNLSSVIHLFESPINFVKFDRKFGQVYRLCKVICYKTYENKTAHLKENFYFQFKTYHLLNTQSSLHSNVYIHI